MPVYRTRPRVTKEPALARTEAGEFRAAVIAVVRRIPKGKLLTYGDVARLSGWPGRPRQVGMILKGLPETIRLPWHRVVNAQGLVPQRARFWGAHEQMQRLRLEGIPVDKDGRLPLEKFRWRPRPRASSSERATKRG